MKPKSKILTLALKLLLLGLAGQINGAPSVEPMLGANGMFFDQVDRLYVASVLAGEVRVLDRNSGETLAVYDKQHGVLSPDDVTLDSEQTMYVTNILQGSVNALRRDGSVVEVANLGWGVNSIAVRSSDGSLWVGRDFLGDGLYQVDPSGLQPVKTILPNPGWINGTDFGPDGMLYGPVFKDSSIVRIDPDTGALSKVLVQLGSQPYALKFNSKGQLHVLEGKPGKVLKMDLRTGVRTLLASYPPGLDNLAFDSTDRLFISSFYDGSVHEVLPNGQLRQLLPPSKRMQWLVLGLKSLPFVIAALFMVLVFVMYIGVRRMLRRRKRPVRVNTDFGI